MTRIFLQRLNKTERFEIRSLTLGWYGRERMFRVAAATLLGALALASAIGARTAGSGAQSLPSPIRISRAPDRHS
jgi:hypothetical protein